MINVCLRLNLLLIMSYDRVVDGVCRSYAIAVE